MNDEKEFLSTPVPRKERSSFTSVAFVWVGWCISVSAFLTGGSIAQGSNFTQTVLSILLANGILAVIGILCGFVGFRTGLTTYSAMKMIFGRKGSTIVNVVNGISLMSFIGVLMSSFASYLKQLYPSFPSALAIILFACCITLSSINGMKGLSMLSNIAAPLLWALLALCLVLTLVNHGGFAPVLAWEPAAGNEISFMAAMSLAIATWVGGAGKTADLTRFNKKKSHIVGGAILGYIAGSGLFELIAAICAISSGEPNIVIVMARFGLVIPAVIILALALWTTTDNNIYSASLAFGDMSEILGLKIPRKVWVIINVLIALVVALTGVASDFSSFLSFFGTIAGPFAGIMIAHFYLVCRPGAKKYFVPENFSVPGFVGWILSFVLSNLLHFDTFWAVISGIVLYFLSSLLFNNVIKLKQKGVEFEIPEVEQ